MLKSIIIDDEKNCRSLLKWAIGQSCPNVEIITECSSGTEGMAAIQSHQPDLVFLDIEMRDMTGFDMLEKLGKIDCAIIFTTAYDQFAINAFKVNAVDYLLKPIDENELKKAVEKVSRRQESPVSQDQMEFLLSQLKKSMDGHDTNIALPSSAGLEFIEVDKIIYCQSDSNYTNIHQQGAKTMVVSKTLKDVEALLPTSIFFRVHHSYTVNLKHIKRYLKADGGYLVMSNGDKVKVSRSKKDLLMELL
ncbi:MAG: two-component system LytT family response regulator [Polaribacter sp.]|jgi:two-component system LytT family response regulator